MNNEVKKYKCEPCDFETDVKCNIIRHTTTKKHLEKMNPPMQPTNIALNQLNLNYPLITRGKDK